MSTPSFRFYMHYFDRNIIRKKWKKMNKDPLEKASNIVMRIARNSIRNQAKRNKTGLRNRLKRRPSRPGRPPYSWQTGKLPPFKQIFSDWLGWTGTSRIVGMVGYGGSGPAVPGLHEHGGWARRTVWEMTPRRTASGRFTTPSMKRVTKMVKYPPRPFMWPALAKARTRYPKLWENSLSRAA